MQKRERRRTKKLKERNDMKKTKNGFNIFISFV